MELGGLGWIFAVNLIVWSGLFFYLMRLANRLAQLEKTSGRTSEDGR